MRKFICLILMLAVASTLRADDLKQRFMAREQPRGSVTLYWLNGPISQDSIYDHIRQLKRTGFTGVSPLPLSKMRPPVNPRYLSDEYLSMYESMLDELRRQGMELIFYDDCDYPSGTAGGRLAKEHPEKMGKYLHRVDTTLEGGRRVVLDIPSGTLMSACMSKPGSQRQIVFSKKVTMYGPDGVSKPGVLGRAKASFDLPKGPWRVQLFLCVIDSRMIRVDGLDPDAMKTFTEMTYDCYYERFPEHFGTTIRRTFYDDPAYWHVPGARAWTEGFNERFEAEYGYSPEALYPSLFEDTGSQTFTDRIRLFSTRDLLNAEGFPKVLSEWAAAHRVKCSGHPANTYRANPLQNMGDALRYFKHQDVPLCDYIHFFRNGIDGYNIPASAAYNYDKGELICEIYGNFRPDSLNDTDMLYRAGMDVYARGINRLLPHGTWHDATRVAIVPEISWRNPRMADGLKGYNEWVSRCEAILQQSRHVAQVGILYPIADLQTRFDFTSYRVTGGREHIRGNDYYNFLRLMTTGVRRDYTLIHPEVVDEKCVVRDGVLRLDNAFNWEEYRVVILPWCKTVYPSNVEKLANFAEAGGKVLFTGCMPEFSAVPGQDKKVKKAVARIMASGGVLLENPRKEELKSYFAENLPDADIEVESVQVLSSGGEGRPETFRDVNYACNYIHKVKQGRDFYFIGNPTDCSILVRLSFDDTREPELWDPHTGEVKALRSVSENGRRTVELELDAVKSLFVVFG